MDAFRAYFQAQGLFGVPKKGQCDYSQVIELDLGDVRPGVSGPKRPQDRIELPDLKRKFCELLSKPVTDGGYGKAPDTLGRRHPARVGAAGGGSIRGGGAQNAAASPRAPDTNPWTQTEMLNNRPSPDSVEAVAVAPPPGEATELGHGDVLIAAITSCTNTSNPSVMLAAGILAKKAVERGLTVHRKVKASLAPGSRVVTDYLTRTGLQTYLDQLGFYLVGYGCTTCIGNSGPLDPGLEEVVTKNDIITASVLSGNRNFEARIQQSIKANFLMSPPLVVAFALAGRIDIDMSTEPLGRGKDGRDVHLKDIWPTLKEVQDAVAAAVSPESYRKLYGSLGRQNPLWDGIPAPSGKVYSWDQASTYIQEPPFFEGFQMKAEPVHDVRGARALGVFGDSVTTDHISPAGSIKADSPAGRYLQEHGVAPPDFNSYGSRRGNDRVMTRGTFANVRIKNLMLPGVEGGETLHQPGGERMSIYDAATRYQKENVSLVVFAGEEYGTGSSRDWAAKGSLLLGVRAVIAKSFERIHRSNLVGMGVLPCQFLQGTDAKSLGIDGTETFELTGIEGGLTPGKKLALAIRKPDGASRTVEVIARIDTPIEVEYYLHGGILPYVLRQLVG